MTDNKELAHFEALYPENSREKEIAKILEYLKKGDSCQVVGLPGVGRSNLLGLLSYNRNVRIKHLGENQKWFHFVYMDMSEVKGRTLYDVIKFILISLSYSLSERNLKDEQEIVNKFLKEAIAFKDDLILFQSLKKSVDFLAIEKELSVILLFDRFDQYIPNISPEFFSNLKILRNRAKYRFSAVFSLNRPIEDILEPAIYSDFYEFLIGNIVHLPLYDASGTEFRFSYLEKVTGKKAEEEVKKEILHLTGGHGKLSRLSYEAVLGGRRKGKGEKWELPKFLLEKNQVRGALYEIWSTLTPYEQQYLRENKESRIKNKEDNTLLYLTNVELLQNNEITIPLLGEFIKTLPAQQEAKIVYDSQRNEILKGSEEITDKLSPSEFRLLRFLIQNEGKVCEKEEIITAVWKDQKTLAGVTDQALDQIIYRLRKKIENDPNNPRFIQTIKGRGYRFTP